jgi:NADPH-dependent glutamate synthase beta subunit-like oxidoreductase
VSQGEIHRLIADHLHKIGKDKAVLRKLLKEKLPATGKKIAIVGAGPAGLTAAYYLARLGHAVIVFDSRSVAGGILMFGIPDYRLPKDVLKREINFIKSFGVKFVFKSEVTAARLRIMEKDFDAIFLATGAYKEMQLEVPGRDLKGVVRGINFLEAVARGQKPALGKRVVIVGAGNVAIDAARTAFRFGCEATIVYRRERADMPANKQEIQEAENEGIRFEFLAAPKSILGKNGKVTGFQISRMKPGEFDLSGRKRPAPNGEAAVIPCETVILAVGEEVDSQFISDFGVAVNKDGTVQATNSSLQSSKENCYAGGDLVMGPSTAVQAMADGKKAAQTIDSKLTGKQRFGLLYRDYKYNNQIPLGPRTSHGAQVRTLPVRWRRNNFKEVSLGLNLGDIETEAARCLRCDVKEVLK